MYVINIIESARTIKCTSSHIDGKCTVFRISVEIHKTVSEISSKITQLRYFVYHLEIRCSWSDDFRVMLIEIF